MTALQKSAAFPREYLRFQFGMLLTQFFCHFFFNFFFNLIFPGALSALYRDVNVVLPDLLSCVESLESQQVRELLKSLGVHEMQPQELLEQHIYPAIRSNKWKVPSWWKLSSHSYR